MDTDICGEDDRSVTSTSTIPFQWICKLKISDGASFGTGFLIKISPDVGHPVLMTAAHVLRKSRLQYVDKVEVYCPGRAKETVYPGDMWASDEFLRDYNWHHDYGFLKLSFSSDSNTGFGWSGYFDKDDIEGIHLHTCGYPSFKKGTSDANADNILYCDTDDSEEDDSEEDDSDESDEDRLESAEYRIEANLDIAGGQSGGPLYAKFGNEYIVFGLVSSGGCPRRHFERLSAEKIHKILDKLGYKMTYKVRPIITENAYLHLDTSTVPRFYTNKGGRVYIAEDDEDRLTKVKIYPVRQTSSNINPEDSEQLFVIRSGTENNIFLHMEAPKTVDRTTSCTVNLQFGIDDGRKEVFYVEQVGDVKKYGERFSIRPREFRDVYLRLNWLVFNERGSDKVNADCHYRRLIDALDVHHLEKVNTE